MNDRLFLQYIRKPLRNPVIREIRIFLEERYRFLQEAKCRFDTDNPTASSYKDYKKALWKHRVTFSEYMYSYEYWKLPEEERDEFISTSEMQCIYRKLGDRKVREVFHNKTLFLEYFKNYIHREWSVARNMSFSDFKDMITRHDCIVKPIDGTRGDGIFKITAREVNNWDSLYQKCIDQNVLLEECIQECEDLACFHPSSLNTIRVVTISNNDKCLYFGALFRMGAHGSIIDNTHAGGIYVPINVETGTIEIEAIDSKNNKYKCHPDSNKPIQGFKIPYWDKIIETCTEATKTIPNIRFAGWDVCVNKSGEVEIIEGNHAPDFDGGMQAPLKIGVKRKLQQAVIDILGVDPIPLISVWKH